MPELAEGLLRRYSDPQWMAMISMGNKASVMMATTSCTVMEMSCRVTFPTRAVKKECLGYCWLTISTS